MKSAKPNRPNIIYVVCHDLGKHLGCYGVPVLSPSLDHFAAHGARFTNAFCGAPACSPSRGCAMTGRYSHTNGLMGLVNYGWSLPDDARTIVDCLNDAGYETAHFGFQHERWRAEANRYAVEGNPGEMGWSAPNRVENAVAGAIDYLEHKRGSADPFYLNIGTLEVHASQWGLATVKDRRHVYGADPPEQVYLPPHVPDAPAFRREFGKFQGAIRFLDTHFRRLLNAVERFGFLENTLVVFTTDHGISAPRAKGSLYDRGVEITLLMQMPGVIAEGEEIADLVSNVDVAPTLLEAADVEVPAGMQGRSFWNRLTGGAYTPREAVFVERNYHEGFPPDQPLPENLPHAGYDPVRAARTDRFHYIRNLRDDARGYWLPGEMPPLREGYDLWFTDMVPPCPHLRDKEELYDVHADPDEFVNLADDPKYEAVKERLAALVDQWMEETNDPVLEGTIPDRLHGWPVKPAESQST